MVDLFTTVLTRFFRRRKEEYSHSLSNPCYRDNDRNDLGAIDCDNDNEYAVCRLQTNGNVYVEMGDGGESAKLTQFLMRLLFENLAFNRFMINC